MVRGDPQRIVKTAAGPSEFLVALDGSELSRTALHAAIRVGRVFRTRIHPSIVTAFRPVWDQSLWT